jgi:hypothetical protein
MPRKPWMDPPRERHASPFQESTFFELVQKKAVVGLQSTVRERKTINGKGTGRARRE